MQAPEVSLLLHQAGYPVWGRAASMGETGVWAGGGRSHHFPPQDGVTILNPFVFPSSATCVPPAPKLPLQNPLTAAPLICSVSLGITRSLLGD